MLSIDSSFLNGYHGKKAQPVFDAACSPTKAGDFIFSLLIQIATQWSGWGVEGMLSVIISTLLLLIVITLITGNLFGLST